MHRELLSLKLTPGTPCSEVKKRAEAKILDIETKISSLQKMKKTLVKLTKACSGSGCCIGPAVFIVSGTSLGFMGRLSFLSPYKNYLLGVAVIMLGYSFRRIYLKKSDCACKENIRVRKIERGIFWVGFAALVLSAIFSRIILWIYG